MAIIDRPRVAQAIADAHQAFQSWRERTGKERGEFLRAIASQMQERADEIASILTSENGKPLVQSQSEVAMSIDHLGWFAEEARRIYGRVVPHQAEGKRHLVIKTPMGSWSPHQPLEFPAGAGGAQDRALRWPRAAP